MPPPRLRYLLPHPPRPSIPIPLSRCRPHIHSHRTNATVASAPPSKPRRTIRPWIWALVFGALGFTAGKLVVATLIPQEFPAAGTQRDTELLTHLSGTIDELPVVKQLREKSMRGQETESLHRDIPLGNEGNQIAGEEERWIELPDPLNLATWTGPEHAKRLLSRMTGIGGLGVSRAFWNANSRELVLVTWIGGGLAGWPGVAHGGVLATLLQEAASVAHGLATQKDGDTDGEPKNLGMTYLKPTLASAFYVIRAKVVEDEMGTPKPETVLGKEKDLAKKAAVEHRKGMKVNCILEMLDGVACVKATSIWPEEDKITKKMAVVVKKGFWR